MGLIDVYRINPADQFSVFSPSLKKTQEITYYTLLAKIRGDLNITSTSGNVDNWNQAYDQTIMSGVVTGYTTKTITLTRRDGTEISFDFQDLSPASEDTLDMVTTRGNNTVNIINVGGVSTPWLDLDTSYTGTTEVGRFSWDIDNATADLGLNDNVVLKIGQDDMWYVRNESGSAIPRGTAVMAVGTVGSSGRILVSPMVANGSVAAKYLLGITSEEIANDADGYVLAKGNLREFNTSAYTAGQVLWCSPTTPGALTATEPAAPNLKLPIAFVVHADAEGMLAVRVTTGSTLSENNQVQFGTLANNDVLTYVSANGRWQNVPISTIASTLAFSTIAVTGQSSIVAETNQDTLNIASGTGISLTTDASTDTLTITNSAPDQIVSLTAGSNVTITGTYPSFTIAATDQYSGTVTSVDLTAGSGMAVAGGPITTSGSITVTNIDKGSDQNIFKNVAVTGQGTIVADSNNDTLTVDPGTGISLTTNATTDTLTITNTAPDQVVSITAGTGMSVSGTYPSFTVTNTAPDQVVSITGAGTSVVTGTYPNFTITSNDQYVGTVTSVNLTAGTGITVSGGPITSSGSITVNNSDRGSSQNIFKNIAVPGQTTIVASTNNDTFTIKPGSGISATTFGNDITLSNTDPGSAQNIFKNFAVAGQNTIVADSNNDVFTFVAGTGVSLTTNDATDSLTVTNSAPDQVVALSSGTGISVSGTYPNFTITNTSPSSGGTVTSVALTAPSAFTVSGSPITTSGTIALGAAGTAAQYIRGDGQLGDFPTTSGGGSSVSYYLNGSVNQGTLGGNVYYEFSKIPILGAGTDFTIATNGYIAQFITDANDPSLLEIPGGNWNLEFYFSSSSSGGTPSFYVELSKYDGTTFTPIASNSSFPEFIAFGTIVSPYFSTLAVPQTTLAATDRLAIRVYVIHSGRTITLHTEDNHLCQVITTFSTGLNALNGLTKQVQYFATGTSGADFNISSVGDTHTFNIPTASGSNRGLLSTSDWINFTAAYNDKINSAAVTGTTTKTLTLTQQDGGTITASWTDYDTAPVTSVFGRTGVVVAVGGDYNTSQVTENTNLYFTNARARTAISLTTTGTSGAATYDNATGILNVPQYQSVLTNPVTGTGTTNYVTKWTSASAVGNSQIFDNGTNVGIGTATPGGKLEVNHTGAQGSTSLILRTSDFATANGTIRWQNNVGTNQAGIGSNYTTGDAGALEFLNGNTCNLIIRSSGNVGIGTTSPAGSLDIYGTTGLKVRIGYFTDQGADDPTLRMFDGKNTRPSYSFTSDNTSGMFGGSGFVAFSTSASEKMRITSAGNVGIGTTAPNGKLQVEGDFYVNGLDRKIMNYNGAVDYGTLTNNSVRFNQNGVERARISTTGNVGIGTTSPGYKLDVNGGFRVDGTNGDFIVDPNGNDIYFTRNGTNYFYGTQASSSFAFYTNSNLGLFQSSAGNVGIGTTSPSYKLDVVGTTRSTTFLSTNATGSTGLQITSNTASAGGAVIRLTRDAADRQIYQTFEADQLYLGVPASNTTLSQIGTKGSVDLSFATAYSERMRITAAGNVGIGTTSPGSLLQVGVGNATANSLVRLGVGYDTIRSSRGGIDWADGANVTGKIHTEYDGTMVSMVFGSLYNSGYNSNSLMVIRGNGNVGIGTTSPASKLTVNASANSNDNAITIYSNNSTAGAYTSIGSYFANGNTNVNTQIRFGNENTSGAGSYLAFATGVSTSATEKMRITSAGNVGIGTTSPSGKLNIAGVTAFNTGLNVNGNTANGVGMSLRNAGGNDWYIISTGASNGGGANNLGFYNDNVGEYRLYVTSGGNVGIGTTAPGSALHVVSGGVASQGTTGHSGMTSPGIWIGGDGTNGLIYGRNSGSWVPTYLDSSALYINAQSAGNVGIGTTSPSAKLHVIGNATVSATLLTANAKITGTLTDSFNQVGTAGQVLSSTGTGIEWITGGGGGGGSTIIVKDEGTTIGSSFTTLNFIGDNVNATASGSTAVIEVTGRASSGSVYYDDVANPFVIPGGGFANVEINAQTVMATVPSSLTGSNKLMATITFGVSNVSLYEAFNGFKFRLYNSGPMSDVQGTTHSWNGFMSKNEGCTTTVFTFHIPIDYSVVTGGDTIVVQADVLTNYTPEIYYCALTLIEGTN